MRKQKVPELIEFIHSKTEIRPDGTCKGVGPLIGCVLARRIRIRNRLGQFDSAVSLGWSKVNTTVKSRRNRVGVIFDYTSKRLSPFIYTDYEPDQFDKDKAVSIARERAITGNAPSMPAKIADGFERMVDRAGRYFKNLRWA